MRPNILMLIAVVLVWLPMRVAIAQDDAPPPLDLHPPAGPWTRGIFLGNESTTTTNYVAPLPYVEHFAASMRRGLAMLHAAGLVNMHKPGARYFCLRVRVGRSGRILSRTVISSSGTKDFDAAVLTLIDDIKKLPPPPQAVLDDPEGMKVCVTKWL